MHSLYGNVRRLAQILDPSSALTEHQKSQLPEDKSFMITAKGSFPTKFKPKSHKTSIDYDSAVHQTAAISRNRMGHATESRSFDKKGAFSNSNLP